MSFLAVYLCNFLTASAVKHARRDSNPQPTVLETATLPIELLAFFLGKLVENIADATRADGFSALANSETNGLLHRDRRDQFDFNRDVITRHDHFHAFGQLDRT